MDSATLEYCDVRPLYFPYLFYYRTGIKLPRAGSDQIIKVTEKEAQRLLKMKNGKLQIFKRVEKRQPARREHVSEVIS